MRRDIPDLSGEPQPLACAAAAAQALADPDLEAAVQAELQEEIERRDGEQLEREARAEARWAPRPRCDRCHSYVSTQQSVCPRCGHIGATADEGQRTSYERAHARRGPRKGLRR